MSLFKLSSTLLMMFVTILCLSGCGLKKKKSDGQGDIIQVYVQGDPATFLNGTVSETKSFITLENKDDFNSYNRGAVFVFSEIEFFKKGKDRVPPVEGNKVFEGEEEKKVPSQYRFIQLDEATYLYKDSRSQIDFEFSINEDSTFSLNKIYDTGKAYIADVLQYSITPDKSNFSFLISINDKKYGSVLISALFYKNNPKDLDSIKTTSVAALGINHKNAEILGADILMFESEINKLDQSNYSPSYKRAETTRALTHEVGHFLGLDHNFEDKNSIMSYEEVYELGYYDRQAISELYSDQLKQGEDDIYLSRKGSANGSY